MELLRVRQPDCTRPSLVSSRGRAEEGKMSRRSTSLSRRRSTVFEPQPDGTPVGPLSGPSNTTWRRQRLLGIGAERPEDTHSESTLLRTTSTPNNNSYGTLPDSARTKRSKSKLSLRRGFQTLQNITIPKSLVSAPPSARVSPTSFGEHNPLFGPSRPLSAYDRPAFGENQDPDDSSNDAKVNGIRVWYSSFTSIDWLHDAIKDSERRSRLRKRASLRGQLRRHADRGIGWFIVSIVGFLTAVVAWMIVRGEQLLFDLKEGYCTESWMKAKRFCCPTVDASVIHPAFVTMFIPEEECPGWRTWAEVFMPHVSGDGKWPPLESEMVEYLSYTAIAVSSFVYCTRCKMEILMLCHVARVGSDFVHTHSEVDRLDVVRYRQRFWSTLAFFSQSH